MWNINVKLLLTVVFSIVYCEVNVDHLQQLILDNINEAFAYDYPKDNSGYFKNVDSTKISDYGSFDFIIVGSGSTGSVLANRLSFENSWRVLLLEAGDVDSPFTDIPSMYQYSLRSKNSWGYNTTSQKYGCKDFGTFDFIVVGGGSSGSVVVNRLTEIKEWSVLLLEAGDVNDDFTDIPYVFHASGKSERNWGYLTVPQKNGCYGRENKQCPYIRGKILGGSGTINGLVYSRGIKSDFEKWASHGNPGWSWNDVLPIIKKLENFQSKKINLKYRGFNGPLNIAYVKPDIPLQEDFIQANKEIGIPFLEDYNAEKVNGVSYIQHNIENGRRVSGANNYLKPAWTRINLNVTLKAFVTKIMIDERTKSAFGVQFVYNNKRFKARAKKEVIVSGGAANSPQLLMLSGIGPKSDLEKLGIEVVQDLPVGKYMKDHIGFLSLYFTSNYAEPAQNTSTLIRKYLEGEGAFTAPSYYRAISYFNTKNRNSPLPNMEIAFAPPSPVVTSFPQSSNYRKEVSDFVDGINQSTNWNFQLFFLHPKSSGTLNLKSANPRDFPLIDSKIFDNEEDIEDMYQGIKVIMQLIDTSIGKKFNLKLNINLPSCSHNKELSKEYWYCLLRQLALPTYHLSSTVKMGPRSDPLAVVNNELKVYGVQNLRVIDVSIVPSTVTGHINAQAFLIGEKGAELIKKEHLKYSNNAKESI